MLDYQTAQKRAGASSVNVNSGGNFKVPAGYMADPENGGRVVPIPGSPAAREAATARVEVEASIASMDDSMSVIDAAMSHPGFDANFGMSSLLKNRPGGDAAGAATFLDQIDGKAFLQAFKSLEGGGQITEIEGQKATQAIARLGRAQSPEDARVALSELRGIIAKARARAEQQLLGFTGGKATPSSSAEELSTADLVKMYEN